MADPKGDARHVACKAASGSAEIAPAVIVGGGRIGNALQKMGSGGRSVGEAHRLASMNARFVETKGRWTTTKRTWNRKTCPAKADGGKETRETRRKDPVMETTPVDAPTNDDVKNEAKSKTTTYERTSMFPDLLRTKGRVGGATKGCGLVWFRADLRLHDHAALQAATKACRSVACVFCFDPREYEASQSPGCDRNGPYRTTFLLQCVQDLRETMRKRGGELHVRIGKPEQVLPEMARKLGAKKVYTHGEATVEDMRVEQAVKKALGNAGVKLETHWASTLYHIDDLPFQLQSMPSTYASFREQVHKLPVREPIKEPKRMPKVPRNLEPGEIPTLQQLGIKKQARVGTSGTSTVGEKLVGGETEAMKRLSLFLQELVMGSTQHLRTKIGKGNNFSSNISPWLAMGCLSPRQMYADIKKKEKKKSAGDAQARQALDWVVFELLWRDFFRFITKKYGHQDENASPAIAAANA